MEALGSYWDGDVLVKEYPMKKVRRKLWQKNDTFYATKMRIIDDQMFAMPARKKGKA